MEKWRLESPTQADHSPAKGDSLHLPAWLIHDRQSRECGTWLEGRSQGEFLMDLTGSA